MVTVGPVTADDLKVIALQLGRRPRDVTGIAYRCPFGRAAVIETAPVLSDGTPNPTLLYLTCPVLAAAVSRVEASGGVRRLRSRYAEDKGTQVVLDEITGLYRCRRALLADVGAGSPTRSRPATADGSGQAADPARLEAGIGGPSGPGQASCLHAYAAALLAMRAGWLSAGTGALDEVAAEVAAGEGGREVTSASGSERVWAEFYPPLEGIWCRDDRCAAATITQRRAVVDVGTISVRLLVADVSGDVVETVVRRTEITRMGEGLRPGGRLLPAAAERTAEAVASFVGEARRLDPSGIIVAGTSATREAADGREFLLALGEGLGVTAVVLSGRDEAELAYAGATLDVGGDPLVLDIGGGSTELSRRRGIRFDTVSLDLGASKATELWIKRDPADSEATDLARSRVRTMLEPLRSRFGGSRGAESTERLVGVAGTVTTLACLAAGLDRYDRDAIHLRPLTAEEVLTQLDRLAAMTLAERAALACVQTGRAPVIVGGAAVLLAVMETLGFKELIVSERDLLDGLALQGPF